MRFLCWLFILLLPLSAAATTAVIFVLPDGIVLAQDSLKTDLEGRAVGKAHKLFAVADRVVVGSWGLSVGNLRAMEEQQAEQFLWAELGWNSEKWMAKARRAIPHAASPYWVAVYLRRELQQALAPLNTLLDYSTERQKFERFRNGIVNLIVAGFRSQNGGPEVLVISAVPHWIREEGREEGSTGGHIDFTLRWHFPKRGRGTADSIPWQRSYGEKCAIDAVLSGRGDQYLRARAEQPALEQLLKGHIIPIGEVVGIAQLLVRFQAAATPQTVGLPVQWAIIPVAGKARAFYGIK